MCSKPAHQHALSMSALVHTKQATSSWRTCNQEPLWIHESLRASEAGRGAVHLRTGAPPGRNGSNRQLPAPWLRVNAFRAEGCRARLSPAREGDRKLWHEPRKGGENLALPGLLT